METTTPSHGGNPTRKSWAKALGVAILAALVAVLTSAFLSGGASVASASKPGTDQPVWCHLTGDGWKAQLGASSSGGRNDAFPLMGDFGDGTTSGGQTLAHDRSSKLDGECANQAPPSSSSSSSSSQSSSSQSSETSSSSSSEASSESSSQSSSESSSETSETSSESSSTSETSTSSSSTESTSASPTQHWELVANCVDVSGFPSDTGHVHASFLIFDPAVTLDTLHVGGQEFSLNHDGDLVFSIEPGVSAVVTDPAGNEVSNTVVGPSCSSETSSSSESSSSSSSSSQSSETSSSSSKTSSGNSSSSTSSVKPSSSSSQTSSHHSSSSAIQPPKTSSVVLSTSKAHQSSGAVTTHQNNGGSEWGNPTPSGGIVTGADLSSRSGFGLKLAAGLLVLFAGGGVLALVRRNRARQH